VPQQQPENTIAAEKSSASFDPSPSIFISLHVIIQERCIGINVAHHSVLEHCTFAQSMAPDSPFFAAPVIVNFVAPVDLLSPRFYVPSPICQKRSLRHSSADIVLQFN